MPLPTNNPEASASADDQLLQDVVERIRKKAQRLAQKKGRLLRFMEVCGTHTVALSRSGLRSALSDVLAFVSGPGCPVCVTPGQELTLLQRYAELPSTTVATFGDMMRVPDNTGVSLAQARSEGASVEVVMSAPKAVELAQKNPDERIVFAAVGFETTAPTTTVALAEARRRGVDNFFCHVTHKLTPPAVFALLSGDEAPRLDGFLCPGHVSAIIGSEPWRPLADDFGYPAVVGGFETPQLLVALDALLDQCAEDRVTLENRYGEVVQPDGNAAALQRIRTFFAVDAAEWRGLGSVPDSGLKLKKAFARFDGLEQLETELDLADLDDQTSMPEGCRCAEVLTGRLIPPECPLFDGACTPSSPVGPCMVSSEGSCAAYYLYER